jgi:polar amino acid transport system substrate-binding protein
MTMKRLLTSALSVVALVAIASQASAQADKLIFFATDQEKTGGFLLELTVEAMKKSGYETKVQFVPWARAVNMVTNGATDGLLGCYYSDERAKVLAYSDLLAESPMSFFALEKSHIKYSTLDDLAQYSIGTIIGAAYPKNFTDAANLRTEAVSSYQQNVAKLVAGRIGLFVEKRFVVENYLSAADISSNDKIVALEPPLVVNKFYNAFSKTVPDAEAKLKAFNEGLAAIRADGTYALIMRKGLHE